ncbi:hypothetical protein RHSIM_Rhsim03G0251000 [Rhododendron simsii]|uniref:CUE domain-containing protein n=1 Tax=Rhododendron simsii TaxID=118357 RepID=A0A834HGZ2_RHOSS|nr:hypothetical protein RHSIM_Rhsim03G0251000 [Rhododendron simsii]
MSAVVCGKRSSFFEDLPSSPPKAVSSSKRIRCSSSSPVRFSPPRPAAASPFSLTSSFSSHSSALDLLSALFPGMDKQLLERALKECGDDLDLAIRSLNELRLGATENLGSDASNSHIAEEEKVQSQAPGIGGVNANGDVASAGDPLPQQNLPMGGADWVELFVREMTNASNMDDARARASRALEVLEKSICGRVTAEAAQTFCQVTCVSLQYTYNCVESPSMAEQMLECRSFWVGKIARDVADVPVKVMETKFASMVSASAGTGAFGFQVMAEGSPELEVIVAEDGESLEMGECQKQGVPNGLEDQIVVGPSDDGALTFRLFKKQRAMLLVRCWENNMLKEQVEALIHENAVLKRAVSIQHERQKEFEDRGQELHHLKEMVSQYQEQLRTLEVNNYALTMHLKQSQQSNSIPGRFHPDVF